MINNRQGGRRRGRGGQRGQNPGGPSGNRQDTRQRGNAAQLLEKYKSMARDAQLAGDRVQTEYYLQFADHYYRVLGDSRARFEEQNPRRQRDDEGDEDGDGNSSFNEQGEEELAEGGDDNGADEREVRAERNEPRQGRGERYSRRDRPARDDSERSAHNEDEPRQLNGGGETIPFDILPPAIGRDESAAEDVSEEQPRRRRRARAPRDSDEGETEIAPAA